MKYCLARSIVGSNVDGRVGQRGIVVVGAIHGAHCQLPRYSLRWFLGILLPIQQSVEGFKLTEAWSK